MGSGSLGGFIPTDPKSLFAPVATGGAYNVWRAAGQAYKAADPLGQEAAKKALEQKENDAKRNQQAQADAEAAALKAAPVKLGAQTALTRSRFLAGFRQTLNTSPLGHSKTPAGTAPTLQAGAPKALLGQ